MSRNEEDITNLRPLTRLARAGRDPSITGPFVNPPVIHASTVLFPDVASMRPDGQRYVYGRHGTPTTEALESAMSEIEGAAGTVLCPSGLSAVSTALLSVVGAGDHLLLADNVYGPTRQFAAETLARLGVEAEFFDPSLGEAVADRMRDNTRAIFVESPGSLTFEMTDIDAVARAAHARGALVLADNTWATPYYFRPLEHGADLSILAGTKYIGGHSDLMLGTVAANETAFPRLLDMHRSLGVAVGPDDAFLALRGLRTLGVRLERHMRSALEVARWLQRRPEVSRVLHPGLPEDPGHAIWQRDMTGASGLFGVVLAGWSDEKAAVLLDSLKLFGLGYSWGGFESLAIPARFSRSAAAWPDQGAMVRLHIGLEDPADLIADLDAAFTAAA